MNTINFDTSKAEFIVDFRYNGTPKFTRKQYAIVDIINDVDLNERYIDALACIFPHKKNDYGVAWMLSPDNSPNTRYWYILYNKKTNNFVTLNDIIKVSTEKLNSYNFFKLAKKNHWDLKLITKDTH